MTVASAISPPAMDPETSSATAREIVDLEQKCRISVDAESLTRLRDLRVNGGLSHIRRGSQTGIRDEPCPPHAADPFPGLTGALPEVEASELTIDVLAGAIRHHGSLIVRNLADENFVAEMRDQIERVLDSCNLFYSTNGKVRASEALSGDGYDPRWFNPSDAIAEYFDKREVGFLKRTGSVYTNLSPQAAYSMSEFFHQAGLKRLLTDYFNDEPCTSFRKSVLRRAQPLKMPADWHQDGAFMTEDIKSINLWLSLSECGEGTDCPGMDLVPKRLPDIVPPGINGAAFKWSVSAKTVSEQFKDTPPVRPWFGEGDAIFFDHLNLHATSYDPVFTKQRYAIETWFFSRSHNAENQIPVLW
ncbi:MAG: hypothetical protein AAF950_04500 [Pseudomonadota bacterium]